MIISIIASSLVTLMVALPQVVTSTAALGTARLSQAVMADGKALPAGTYQVRLTTETPAQVVGQDLTESRWVEFLRGGTVVGRELATVVTAEEMRVIANMPRGPGAVRVQMLKGGDYVRVWVLHDGAHVLIHLAVTS